MACHATQYRICESQEDKVSLRKFTQKRGIPVKARLGQKTRQQTEICKEKPKIWLKKVNLY